MVDVDTFVDAEFCLSTSRDASTPLLLFVLVVVAVLVVVVLAFSRKNLSLDDC